MSKITIVGAGFSGLATAYFLTKKEIPVEIYEESLKPGGMIQTLETPWGLSETAANGMLNSVVLENLAQDVGVKLIPTRREARRRYIWRQGLKRWPLTVFETLGMLFRFLLCRERHPRKFETVSDWCVRVFGKKSLDYLLAPALQGIYAGDPYRMSATLIFSRFFKKIKRPKPQLKGLVAPEKGMGQLIEAMASFLQERGVQIHYGKTFDFTGHKNHITIIASPCSKASDLLQERSPRAGILLGQIEVLPLISVTVFYPEDAKKFLGFGCLFPRNTGFRALGVLANTQIFEGRSRNHSETWIYGVGLSDEEVMAQIAADRKKLFKSEENPLGHKINRWPKALPHYTVELEKVLDDLKELKLEDDGVFLMGNYLGSLGLSQIILRARELSEKISKDL